ncbi:type I-U CRISPR-associated helicase/endonuclease Cas3 [Streptomyces sp. NPDC088745]|uniref:type I-G CRISPR-associated helicase/endonuclease Cas3g n=1 Tax=Streptomyces sp. NPDC088745 TaxID=3365884 RepID=UPI00382D308A
MDSTPKLAPVDLEEFPVFFEAVHGYEPFPWQCAYVESAAKSGVWPDLDVPTGLGKTSLIDIWVFLLAWQHANGQARTVPLRLFFVVDRRLVVDQAHEHATTLRKVLQDALQCPAQARKEVVVRVARALAALGGEGQALETLRMRGGVDWASRWLRSPAQPAVITSTVDQYGSRLLFRGYHTSPRMRPVDAALCGIDALLAVDKAHIALPLLETATDCARYQATATDPTFADRAVKVVSLSATATSGDGRPRHSLTEADHYHPVARRRLRARRRVTLLDATASAKNATEAFAITARLGVEALLPVVERPVIGVVANTIRAARAAHRLLAADDRLDVVLLTGRSRAGDRTRLLDSPHLIDLLAGVNADLKRPLVVVATQTVEVGLDVSFAGLVTENASYAAFVQRLGRLDRTGDATIAAPALVIRAHAPADFADIPVYGTAAQETWDWLATHAPLLKSTELDAEALGAVAVHGKVVNPTTLPRLLANADLAAMSVAKPLIPVVHRTLLDSWARTSPTPVPDQSTAPFLHGMNTSPEDVQVLWRADLPPLQNKPDHQEVWEERMRQAPPHPDETVPVPAQQLRRFLTQPGQDTTSDLEGIPDDEVPPKARRAAQAMAPVLRWHPETDTWTLATEPRDIRPGSTIVLPSHYSGHDPYGWTAAPGRPVADLGDYPPRTDTAPTRLDPQLLATLADFDDATLAAVAEDLHQAHKRLCAGDEDEPPTQVIHLLLDSLLAHLDAQETPAHGSYSDLLHQRLTDLKAVTVWDIDTEARVSRAKARPGHAIATPGRDTARIVLVPPHPQDGCRERTAGVGDQDGDASSLTRPVALDAHGTAVAKRARYFADTVGLPAPLVSAVATAAWAHDVGKAHPRFQIMLCAGDRLLAESQPHLLAKSGMDPADQAGRRRAAKLAHWGAQLRHEALSATAVAAWLATRPEHTEGLDEDLLVHLAAAHHGHARPLLPPVTDPDPAEVTCTMPDGQQVTVNSASMGVDWDSPDRFHTLNRRYGPWGLALLETLVRLADMACSEEGT